MGPAIRWLPAGAVGCAGEEGTLTVHLSETRDRRGKAGGLHGCGHRDCSRGDAVGDPVVPFGELVRGRSFGCVQQDAAASAVGDRLSLNGSLCRRAGQTNDCVLLRGEGRSIEITVDAQIVFAGILYGNTVSRSFDDEPLAREGGLYVHRESPGEESKFSVWSAVRGAEVIERENRVFSEVGGRGVFKLDLGAALAGHEVEAGCEWKISRDLFPGSSFVFSAGDADVALDETNADDLRVDIVGRWRTRCRGNLLHAARARDLRAKGSDRTAEQQKNGTVTEARDAQGNPRLGSPPF